MAASGFNGKKWQFIDHHDERMVTTSRVLVHAASIISTRDRRKGTSKVCVVDMRPVVLHLLDGLQRAGFESCVISLGDNAAKIVAAVQQAGLHMQICFVHVPEGVWRTLANTIVCARTAFPNDEPFLVVRADQLYDWRLLHRVRTQARFEDGIEAFALVDTEPATLHWASGAHCTAACKESGRCNALVKVKRNTSTRRVASCGHRLVDYDAVTAGDVYVARASIFALLRDETYEAMYRNTAEAMAKLAARGALGYIDVGDYHCHWFGARTLTAVSRAASWASTSDLRAQGAGLQSGREGKGWQHIVSAARDLMLGHSDDDASCPFRRPWPTSKMLLPLLRLGETIGRGSNCKVVEGEAATEASDYLAGGSSSEPLEPPSRVPLPELPVAASPTSRRRSMAAAHGGDAGRQMPLAVKLYETGHSSYRGAGAVMREVIWEVHVLRQVAHSHIVRLWDSIEFTDAVFVVMARYDGPELHQHIASQPSGVLCESQARLFFGHLLDAVRHAHSRGYLHCDLKPANIRLNVACDWAVLVDWGMARDIHHQKGSISCGSPLYASPEQLTGHNPECVMGTQVLFCAADVWSLGATLHEMVHGAPPFAGESFEDLVSNVMKLRYAPIPEARQAVGQGVRILVDSMLQLVPSERASITELCRNDWVVRDAPLPPPVPLPMHRPSGGGFVEGADIDGLIRRRNLTGPCGRDASKLSRCVQALWRTVLTSVLGRDANRDGERGSA